jgi:hypothetical protein
LTYLLVFEFKILSDKNMSFSLDNKRGTELEFNNSPEEAQEISQGQIWMIGNITRSTDVDYYTFSVDTREFFYDGPTKVYTNGPPFIKYSKVEITIGSGIPYSDEIINQDSYVDDGSIKLSQDRFGWTAELINSSGEKLKTIIIGMDDESFEVLLTNGTYYIKLTSYDKENSGLAQDYNGTNYGVQWNFIRFKESEQVLDLEYDKSEYSYLYDYDPDRFDYLNPSTEFSYLTRDFLSQKIPNGNTQLEPIQLKPLSGTNNYSKGNDIIVLTGSGDTERGLEGDDYYLVSGLIPTNSSISIVDTSGLNKIQIPDGTFIDKTLFTKNAVRITLEDSRVITINGADKFEYNIGANITSGDTSNDLSFSDFALIFGLTDILNSSGTLDGPVIDAYVL